MRRPPTTANCLDGTLATTIKYRRRAAGCSEYSFCRGFASSLLGDGGVGKTALRYAQALSLATGCSLTGEHVFQRCRVLIVSLEDGRDELRRRIQGGLFASRSSRAS